MAEITEVFEDFGDNTKKLFKNKKFWLLAGAVGVVALVAGYKKNQNDVEAVSGFEAIGYAGYPTVGGSSSSDYVSSDSDYLYASDENLAYYESLLGESQIESDAALLEMESNIQTLSDRLLSAEEMNASYMETIERQNAISQMRANSELYNTLGAGDYAIKQALHAENMNIAEKYGWEFDPSTGNYLEGNSVVYTTAKQQAGYNTAYTGGKTAAPADVSMVNNATYTAAKQKAATSGTSATVVKSSSKKSSSSSSSKKSSSSSKKGYNPNVDYSKAIASAVKAGESKTYIAGLQKARDAKINDMYGGKDPAQTAATSKAATTTTKKDTTTKAKGASKAKYNYTNTHYTARGAR